MLKSIRNVTLISLLVLPSEISVSTITQNHTNSIEDIIDEPRDLQDELLIEGSSEIVNNGNNTEGDFADGRLKAVSLDFGGKEDERVFLKRTKEFGYSVHRINHYQFSLGQFWSEQYKRNVEDNAKKLDDLLVGADILLLSGHHRIESSIIYGSVQDFFYDKGINVYKIGHFPEVDIIIANFCHSVSSDFAFTKTLIDRFPNAIIFGYENKDAPSAINANVLEYFMQENPFGWEKIDMAIRWINACQEVYGRDLNAHRNPHVVWQGMVGEKKMIYDYSLSGLNVTPTK